MSISRRDALATGAAAMVTSAAVATVAAPAVQAACLGAGLLVRFQEGSEQRRRHVMKGIHLTTIENAIPGLKFAGAVYLLGVTAQITAWNKKLTINFGTNLLG